MTENYNRIATPATAVGCTFTSPPMDLNLHSLPRRLIEMRIEHGDLDNLIDRAVQVAPSDDLTLRRLKKRRLLLRDAIARLEAEIDPPTTA